jgi:hypothetical protein
MTERRALVEGIKPKPEMSRAVEEDFIYGSKARSSNSQAAPSPKGDTVPNQSVHALNRVGLTTRIRADLAQALKRCSLERQLQGVEPNRVQDILEQALEPWLRSNGYLT